MTRPNYTILPVADVGLTMKFSDVISDSAQAAVLAADLAVKSADIEGLTETVPSYASLYVGYDPLLTDFRMVCNQLKQIDIVPSDRVEERPMWDVPVCYEEPYAPDLPELADKLRMDPESAILTHLSGNYLVSMYGFAPGYAYMRGVPERLRAPRKLNPVPDVPAGSVIVAGVQCLVTTLVYPTGWWAIGRSPFEFIKRSEAVQFPVAVGSRIRFRRISATEMNSLYAERRG